MSSESAASIEAETLVKDADSKNNEYSHQSKDASKPEKGEAPEKWVSADPQTLAARRIVKVEPLHSGQESVSFSLKPSALGSADSSSSGFLAYSKINPFAAASSSANALISPQRHNPFSSPSPVHNPFMSFVDKKEDFWNNLSKKYIQEESSSSNLGFGFGSSTTGSSLGKSSFSSRFGSSNSTSSSENLSSVLNSSTTAPIDNNNNNIKAMNSSLETTTTKRKKLTVDGDGDEDEDEDNTGDGESKTDEGMSSDGPSQPPAAWLQPADYQVINGEEGERCVFQVRAKLYRLDHLKSSHSSSAMPLPSPTSSSSLMSSQTSVPSTKSTPITPSPPLSLPADTEKERSTTATSSLFVSSLLSNTGSSIVEKPQSQPLTAADTSQHASEKETPHQTLKEDSHAIDVTSSVSTDRESESSLSTVPSPLARSSEHVSAVEKGFPRGPEKRLEWIEMGTGPVRVLVPNDDKSTSKVAASGPFQEEDNQEGGRQSLKRKADALENRNDADGGSFTTPSSSSSDATATAVVASASSASSVRTSRIVMRRENQPGGAGTKLLLNLLLKKGLVTANRNGDKAIRLTCVEQDDQGKPKPASYLMRTKLVQECDALFENISKLLDA